MVSEALFFFRSPGPPEKTCDRLAFQIQNVKIVMWSKMMIYLLKMVIYPLKMVIYLLKDDLAMGS